MKASQNILQGLNNDIQSNDIETLHIHNCFSANSYNILSCFTRQASHGTPDYVKHGVLEVRDAMVISIYEMRCTAY